MRTWTPPRTFPKQVMVKTTIYFANAFFPKVETASLGAPLLDFFDSKKIGRTDFTRKRVYFFWKRSINKCVYRIRKPDFGVQSYDKTCNSPDDYERGGFWKIFSPFIIVGSITLFVIELNTENMHSYSINAFIDRSFSEKYTLLRVKSVRPILLNRQKSKSGAPREAVSTFEKMRLRSK